MPGGNWLLPVRVHHVPAGDWLPSCDCFWPQKVPDCFQKLLEACSDCFQKLPEACSGHFWPPGHFWLDQLHIHCQLRFTCCSRSLTWLPCSLLSVVAPFAPTQWPRQNNLQRNLLDGKQQPKSSDSLSKPSTQTLPDLGLPPSSPNPLLISRWLRNQPSAAHQFLLGPVGMARQLSRHQVVMMRPTM